MGRERKKNRDNRSMYRVGKDKSKCSVVLYSKNYTRPGWTGLERHRKGSILYYDKECTHPAIPDWHARIMKSGAYRIGTSYAWVEVVDLGTGNDDRVEFWLTRFESGCLVLTTEKPMPTYSGGYRFSGEVMELKEDLFPDVKKDKPVKVRLTLGGIKE